MTLIRSTHQVRVPIPQLCTRGAVDVEEAKRSAEQARNSPMVSEADYCRHAWAATVLDLIAALREAEDQMNVCARCGAAIEAEPR